MIAEVGGIVNVSGSKMATPLAPPKTGEHADDDAEHDADHHQHQIERRQHNGKAVEQGVQFDQMPLRARGRRIVSIRENPMD